MQITQVQITFEDGSTQIITPASRLVPDKQGTGLEELKVESLQESKELEHEQETSGNGDTE